MSHPSPSPAAAPFSPPQTQSASPTKKPQDPMSISSMLTNTLPPTPPDNKTTSAEDHHAAKAAAKAPQVPSPDSTTQLVNGPAVAPNDAETSPTTGRLGSEDVRSEADEHHESPIVPLSIKSLEDTVLNSSYPPVDGKGKGKDPEICEVEPAVDANNQPCHEDRSAADIDTAETLPTVESDSPEDPEVYQAASILVRMHNATPESEVASILQNLGNKNVLTAPVVDHEPDHLSSSQSEDKGPLPSTAPRLSFTIPCDGNHVQNWAFEGNAVHDLVPLRKRRYDLADRKEERSCYHCKTLHKDYVEGYMKLKCKNFEREDTVSLEDDNGDDNDIAVVDRPTYERRRAAAEEQDYNYKAYLATLPKMKPKTIQRIEAEKRAWIAKREQSLMPPTTTKRAPRHTQPRPLTAAADNMVVRAAAIRSPVRLPLYLRESNVRGVPDTPLGETTTAEQHQPPTEVDPSPARPLPPIPSSDNNDQQQATVHRTPPPPPFTRPGTYPRSHSEPGSRMQQQPRRNTARATAKMPSPLKQVQTVSSESESGHQQSQHDDNVAGRNRAGAAGRAAAPSEQEQEVSTKAGETTLGRQEGGSSSAGGREGQPKNGLESRERGQNVPNSSLIMRPSFYGSNNRRQSLILRPPRPPLNPYQSLPQQQQPHQQPPPTPAPQPQSQSRKRKAADAPPTQPPPRKTNRRAPKENPEPAPSSWCNKTSKVLGFCGNNQVGPVTRTRKLAAEDMVEREEREREEAVRRERIENRDVLRREGRGAREATRGMGVRPVEEEVEEEEWLRQDRELWRAKEKMKKGV